MTRFIVIFVTRSDGICTKSGHSFNLRSQLLPHVTSHILESMDRIAFRALETLNDLRTKVEKSKENYAIMEELIDTNQGN